MAVQHEQLLDDLRPVAFAIAYRMLGSASEAEDVVQEALVRLHRALADDEPIDSPRAYLATVTTRLAIDALRSARRRREHYFGDWLPEPILTDSDADPAVRAEMADSMSLAMLVLLESLSPEQRAVLLLHDVFDYGYAEIAAILDRTPESVRQLGVRARRQVEQRRPRFEPSHSQRQELARRFFAAVEEGDLRSLEELLAEDVVLQGDGGGRVPALARAQHGPQRVAHALTTWARQARRVSGGELRQAEINGQPGALLLYREGIVGVWALDIAGGRIRAVRSVINPDKLTHLGPVGDMWQALAERQ